ncbi:MAG: class I SAM-dependent methyltransferase [Steroidobacteraceae bacterium]|jgi:SAM-dependent methyltransferase|nr:class I SAM-dependent methyltransferase [Steroidobacteraceae bacterium]
MKIPSKAALLAAGWVAGAGPLVVAGAAEPGTRLSPVPAVPSLPATAPRPLAAGAGAPLAEGQGATAAFPGQSGAAPLKKDVPYVPTMESTVLEMLRLARVGPKDVVYDLGCGDGRIVIAGAQKYGARGVGVDIDPARIAESRENARAAGVEDRVRFEVGDLFETDISEATVVTLYLLPEVNLRLKPKLLAELKPGTRIVSHAFDMGDWTPEQVSTAAEGTVYLWRVPKR